MNAAFTAMRRPRVDHILSAEAESVPRLIAAGMCTAGSDGKVGACT